MDDEGFVDYQNGNLPVAVLAEPIDRDDRPDGEERNATGGDGALLAEWNPIPAFVHDADVAPALTYNRGRAPVAVAAASPQQAREDHPVVMDVNHDPNAGNGQNNDGIGVVPLPMPEQADDLEGPVEARWLQQQPQQQDGQEAWMGDEEQQREQREQQERLQQQDRHIRGGRWGGGRGRVDRSMLRMRMWRRMMMDRDGDDGNHDGDDDDDDLHRWMLEDDEDEVEWMMMMGAAAAGGEHNLVDPRIRRRLGGGRRARLAANGPVDDDNNNNNNNNDGNDAPQQAVAAVEAAAPADAAVAVDANNDNVDEDGVDQATTRGLDSVSSYLFDLIRENRTCTSILSGWSPRSQGCNTVVQHCINNPEQAFYVSVGRRTAVHEACLRGACRHVVQALLAANQLGAMDRDVQGNTALHLLFVDFSSSQIGSTSSVLSPEGIDQVVGDLLAIHPSVMASATNLEGNTALHISCMAPEAMIDPNTIVQLLNANPDLARRVNNQNQTPLRLHCQRRNASVRVARLLLEANPDALRTLDGVDGWAPIHYAAANANLNLIQFLVGAYPESVRIRTTKSQTALLLLCQQHHNLVEATTASPSWTQAASQSTNRHDSESPQVAKALSLLLEADPTAVVQRDAVHSYTPLHLVCKAGGARQDVSFQVVRQLLKFNPHAAAIPDVDNYLPLHHACEVGCNVEVIDVLLDAYPPAASAMTRKHDSALSLACAANKSVETVQRLIRAHPRALTTKNDYGFAPLHCVCRAYQPRMGIVQALIDAGPECVSLQTNAGETPIHLAGGNSSAFLGVLQLLTMTSNLNRPGAGGSSGCTSTVSNGTGVENIELDPAVMPEVEMGDREHDSAVNYARHQQHQHRYRTPSHRRRGETLNTNSVNGNSLTNKMGNTPLHDACFRGSPFEHIETLAMANPEWILIRNNAGYTPLQILCKNGRIDERIVTTFASIGGPEIFSVMDSNGNTPLHSAMREDTDVASLKCLIRAFPDALHSKTIYGDSPLHLACFRRASPDVVSELAMAASSGQASLVLEQNLAGQTPIGIAMEEFLRVCQHGFYACCVSMEYRPEQKRVFDVLATLVKILFYGPVLCQQKDQKDLSLLRACVTLHRQDVRLDPSFIRRAIHMYPEEAQVMDENGNYPLHIESSIPIEKMSLLDGHGTCCKGRCHQRMGVLRTLLEVFPNATKARNKDNHFPLGLMIRNGRMWGHTIAFALRSFPPALHWYKGLDDRVLPKLLEKASKECGPDTLFALFSSRPDLFEDSAHRNAVSSAGS